MNRREAQRIASGLVADLAWQHEERLVRAHGQSPDDRSRLRAALAQIQQEMSRRAARAGEDHAPDPDQVELFAPPQRPANPCCEDTGYSANAAIPCENPQCTAVARVIAEHWPAG